MVTTASSSRAPLSSGSSSRPLPPSRRPVHPGRVHGQSVLILWGATPTPPRPRGVGGWVPWSRWGSRRPAPSEPRRHTPETLRRWWLGAVVSLGLAGPCALLTVEIGDPDRSPLLKAHGAWASRVWLAAFTATRIPETLRRWWLGAVVSLGLTAPCALRTVEIGVPNRSPWLRARGSKRMSMWRVACGAYRNPHTATRIPHNVHRPMAFDSSHRNLGCEA